MKYIYKKIYPLLHSGCICTLHNIPTFRYFELEMSDPRIKPVFFAVILTLRENLQSSGPTMFGPYQSEVEAQEMTSTYQWKSIIKVDDQRLTSAWAKSR